MKHFTTVDDACEIAELFLCKIFQIVIKFMNQNKLLSQHQHQGLDWTEAFNLEGSLFVAEKILLS